MGILPGSPHTCRAKRRRTAGAFVAVFSLFLPAVVTATESDAVSVGPTPAWVQSLEMNPDEPAGDTFGGQIGILQEIQVNAEREEVFQRSILGVANQTGLAGSNEVTLEVDPSYQVLTIHRVGIHRDGQYLDRLEQADIQVIRQETELERSIYNGRLTAIVILDDVRVGDRIEWSATKRGSNSALGGRFETAITLQSPWSMEQRRVRVLHATDRRIHRQIHGAAPEPEIRDQDGMREILWDFSRQSGVEFEDLLPERYLPLPLVRFSECGSWEEVVNWALPIYDVPMIHNEELLQRVAGWRKLPQPEERVLAALRFVQGEIRHLAFAIGPGSLRPTDPNTVFSRRFGDCKDKSLLLCTILRACGIESRPALVNTVYQDAIEDWLSSPFSFDHVIIHVSLGSKRYWLDPTLTLQRGDLSSRSALPYRRALIVAPGTRELSIVPPHMKKTHTKIRERFRVAHHDSAVTLEVKTIFEGADADRMRHTLTGAVSDLGKLYTNFYAGLYGGTTQAAPLKIEQDSVANRITVWESYSIQDFWQRDESTDLMKLEIAAHGISHFVQFPSHRIRSMPLAVIHPFRATHIVEIQMPEGDDWELEPEHEIIEDEAFRFEVAEEFNKNRIRCTFSLESRADAVPAERVAEYVTNLETVSESLTFSLYRHSDGSMIGEGEGLNWAVLLAAVTWGILAVAGVAAFLVFASRRWPPAMPIDADPALSGIRGWLILVAIGVFVGPFFQLYGLLSDNTVYSAETWHLLTMPGTVGYHPWWAPVLLFELFGNIALLVLSCMLVFLFFRRRRAFPRVYIFALLAGLGFVAVDTLLAAKLLDASQVEPALYRDLRRGLIQAVIWIPYMLFSKRVKATFIW